MKKIFTLLICCVLFLLPISCNRVKEENAVVNGYISLESFDDYATMNKIWFHNTLSSASVNNEYVTEGVASMRVEVGDPAKYADQLRSSIFYIPTNGEKGDYHDFSMIDELAIDVYGLQGSELKISLALVLKGKSFTTGPSKSFEIKKGEWNNVRFSVNRTVTDAGIDIEKISHISVECTGVNAVMCLDNLRLHKTTKPFVSAKFFVDKENGELCDFEKPYQSFAVTSATINGITPKLEVVTDPEWATSGARSLKVTSPVMVTNEWNSIEFSQRLLDCADFNLATATSYVAYDIYKPFARSWWLTTRLCSNASGAYTNVSIDVPEGIGWHTVVIPMTRRVLNTTNLQINWQSKNGLPNGGVEETVFYIDNIRIINEVPTNGSIYLASEE